jgi:maleylacetoacetate isomerase/maleylpyruvate isomerase
MVERYGDGKTHCFGDSVTMADVCLVPQMFNAQRFECDLTPYPRLTAIAAALEPHPAFAQAHPSEQPDAE